MEDKQKILNSLLNSNSVIAFDLNSFFELSHIVCDLKDNDSFKVIPILGVIGENTLGSLVKEEIKKADNNILLYFDSVGGRIEDVFLIKEALNAFKANSNGYRCISYVHQYCSSAAYWIASFTDAIYANPDLKPLQKIGNIGVKVLRADLTEKLKMEGVKYEAFVSSENKLMFDNAFSMTDQQKNLIQAKIDKLANLFFEDVAKNRNLAVEAVRRFDAFSFDGEEASSNGLVDGFTTISEIADRLKGVNMVNVEKSLNPFPSMLNTETEKALEEKIKSLTDELNKAKEELATMRGIKEKAESDLLTFQASLSEEKKGLETELAKTKKIVDKVIDSKRHEAVLAYQSFSGVAMKEDSEKFQAIQALDDLEDLNVFIAKYKKLDEAVVPVETFKQEPIVKDEQESQITQDLLRKKWGVVK